MGKLAHTFDFEKIEFRLVPSKMINETQKDILLIFGRHVEAIRKRKKLSYRKIAQNCDIDYSNLSKIEKGVYNITLMTMLELAKGLAIEAKELLEFKI